MFCTFTLAFVAWGGVVVKALRY